MVRRLTLIAVVAAIVALGAGCAPAPTPVALTLGQGPAFSILGHSCGGIQMQEFATGFDPASGLPTGVVYMQTRCGGSGRGGGYQTTTYSAWAAVTWDLAGVVSASGATAAPAIDTGFTQTDGNGDREYTSLGTTGTTCSPGVIACTYHAYLTVPIPPPPTGVTVGQASDSLQVSWSQTNTAVSSSTVTAVPTGGGATLTTTVAGAATTGSVPGVQPLTEYSVTVVSTTTGGTSTAAGPVLFTTGPAVTVPAAPSSVSAAWAGAAIQVNWSETDPGDSPITNFQVQVATHDPAGPWTTIDNGTATTASLGGLDPTLDHQVRVRAVNAAGPSDWSGTTVIVATD